MISLICYFLLVVHGAPSQTEVPDTNNAVHVIKPDQPIQGDTLQNSQTFVADNVEGTSTGVSGATFEAQVMGPLNGTVGDDIACQWIDYNVKLSPLSTHTFCCLVKSGTPNTAYTIYSEFIRTCGSGYKLKIGYSANQDECGKDVKFTDERYYSDNAYHHFFDGVVPKFAPVQVIAVFENTNWISTLCVAVPELTISMYE